MGTTLAFDLTCIHVHCCEVLGKLLNLPEPQFSYHTMGLIIVPHVIIMETKQCNAHEVHSMGWTPSNCSINEQNNKHLHKRIAKDKRHLPFDLLGDYFTVMVIISQWRS